MSSESRDVTRPAHSPGDTVGLQIRKKLCSALFHAIFSDSILKSCYLLSSLSNKKKKGINVFFLLTLTEMKINDEPDTSCIARTN